MALLYFCAALGFVGAMAARKLRTRFPALSTQGILAILFVGDFVFDIVVENLIIRGAEAYSVVQTSGPLTLWAGEQYQFVTRALASIGFCAAVLMMCYHLPFNWISLTGGSFADLPSYLRPAGL